MFSYNLQNILKLASDVMRPVLTEIESFTCLYDGFAQSLKSKYSKDGSNVKSSEVTTFKALLDTVDGKITSSFHW